MSPSLMQILVVVFLVLIFFGRGRISNFMGDLANGIKDQKAVSYTHLRAHET